MDTTGYSVSDLLYTLFIRRLGGTKRRSIAILEARKCQFRFLCDIQVSGVYEDVGD